MAGDGRGTFTGKYGEVDMKMKDTGIGEEERFKVFEVYGFKTGIFIPPSPLIIFYREIPNSYNNNEC